MTVDEIQFGFMSERGTIDAVFMLRRLKEEYHAKGSVGMGIEEEMNTRGFG